MKIETNVPTLDLAVYRGDTFVQSMTFTAAGVPLDLTGWTFAGQVRQYAAAPDVAATFVVDATQLALGKVTISLAAADTTTLGNGVWDLQSTKGATVQTRLRGSVTVDSDVTR